MAKNRDSFLLKSELLMRAESSDAEIMVYSSIVSEKWYPEDPEITAKEFDKQIKDARSAGAERLTLRVNSPGGAVYQAIAMRNMLMTAGFEEVNVRIEGLCASAATLLCCVPGANVRIAEGSMFMIHNPYTIAIGNADELEHQAEILRKDEAQFRAIYCARCGRDDEEVKNWMDAETWFTAKEAVDAGFCDGIEGANEAAACAGELALMREMYRHTPEMSVRNEAPASAPTENKVPQEEDTEMDVKDITIEMLRSENPALYNSIMQAGANEERERIGEIDALTESGYEEMAAQAKESGMSALDFHKSVIAARKEKAKNFLSARKEETEPSAAIEGGEPQANDEKANDAKMEQDAKDIAEYARVSRFENAGGMF